MIGYDLNVLGMLGTVRRTSRAPKIESNKERGMIGCEMGGKGPPRGDRRGEVVVDGVGFEYESVRPKFGKFCEFSAKFTP